MKLLKAYEWLRENHKKYPNGTSVDIVMTAYAKYYYNIKQLKSKPNAN